MTRRPIPVLPLLLACLAAACGGKKPGGGGGGGSPHVVIQSYPAPAAFVGDWKGVRRLIKEQKLQAAAKKAEALMMAARERRLEGEWAYGLIETTRLRMALHGYETAVRFLKTQPWPPGAVARAPLYLYFGRALVTYARRYRWEVSRREKVVSAKKIDLKRWTREQIYQSAAKAFAEVFGRRADLGARPLKHLARYLHRNTFPTRIRGTVRDAVSYLFVDLLADGYGWRPSDRNDLHELNLGALLTKPPRAKMLDLTDPAVHPIKRITAILEDLAAWHGKRGAKEAALEARLERARRLRAAFTKQPDRDRIRADLERRLSRYRDVPWWSMGIAVLADSLRADGENVRAHALARQGARAYPKSLGAAGCQTLIRQIEAWSFAVSSMRADGVRKRSVEVRHRNLQKLFFRAYWVDLKERLESAKDYDLLPGYREIKKLLDETPVAQWETDLPATPDYKEHRSYVTPPLSKPGLYVIIASKEASFRPSSPNQVRATNLLVTDLVLLSRNLVFDRAGVQAIVVSGSTGKPVPGAEVVLYRFNWRKGHRVVARKKTGAGGEVEFQVPRRRPHFLLASHQGQHALDPSYRYAYARSRPGRRSYAFIYTDRSIYRPLQKLHFKIVAYSGDRDVGTFRTMPRRGVTVRLLDPNRQEVARKSLTTNSMGTAAGEFIIPKGRLLGRWQLRSWPSGSASIRVEEYKRPTFETKLEAPKTALRLNRPATFTGIARYYFGLPVVNAKVRWRVTRVPVYRYFGWWGCFGYAQPVATSQTVASGASQPGPDGRFKVAFTPVADERDAARKHVSYRYQVTADVTDEGGETRTATRSFRLGFVSVEATLRSERGFLLAGSESTLIAQRTDLNGAPRAGRGRWRLLRVRQPAQAVLPADEPLAPPPAKAGAPRPVVTAGDLKRTRQQPRYSPTQVMRRWADGGEVARGALKHGPKGTATIRLPKLAPGVYRVRYETIDDFGARFTTATEIVVAGGNKAPARLPLLLLSERSTVKVGEHARLLAFSALPGQLLLVERFRDGRRVSHELRGPDAAKVIEIPVTEKDRGGFALIVTAVRDHQLMVFQQAIHVPWDNRKLAVSFTTFRDKIRPGAKETWRVTVRSPQGEGAALAGSVELLAYMYDRSLDLFAPHSPPSPLSVYPRRAQGTPMTGSMGTSRSYGWGGLYVPGFRPPNGDSLKFYGGYAIGGPGRRGGRFAGLRATGTVAQEAEAASTPAVDMAVASRSSTNKNKDAFKSEQKAADREDAGGSPAQGKAAPRARSNFAETAFWKPHLLLGEGGSASIEFTVPDSVTSWNVWVHGITRDLRAGSVKRETRSVKDLMVRPYLPRFFREGDVAELRVVVNNASDRALAGQVTLDIIDPDTRQSVMGLFKLAGGSQRSFRVAKGSGANVRYRLTAPPRVGSYAFKVMARTANFGDGELRPLPVLPSRMHLMQSRFAVLKNRDRKTVKFGDLAKTDDPSRINERLVVTVDAQLFYQVLGALPYLVSYPYECTEQTLNRFVSTGIVSHLYDKFPAVARMAKKLSSRSTRLESWDGADANRKMALEETPWLELARGGRKPGGPLVNVLDPRITRAERQAALAKLRKAQTSLGAFPWFPGGPPSPYMTLYIVHGFAKAVEFGVKVPKDMVQRAWRYLARHFREKYIELMRKKNCCWEWLTFLGYVASAFPDASWTAGALTQAERAEILDFSFKHWKQHSPFLKGYLALTLKRANREKDARLVFDSVMDSAKTTEDQGTFWAPEDRGWLWYNDTIETHAFALRTLTELLPTDKRRHGLVQWLLLNKKMNQWKSTRATAEVIYSLVHYLKAEGALGVREDTTVTIGPKVVTFVFEPDEFTGKKNQVVIPGPEVDGTKHSSITVEKESKGTVFASATWHFSTEKLPTEDRGDFFKVSRRMFKRTHTAQGFVLTPLGEGTPLRIGEEVEVQISMSTKSPAEYVHLRVPRAAGFEPENAVSRHRWEYGIVWYEETRDSGNNFFFERLPQGEYTFRFRIRASMAGTFRVGPATVQSMYAPEFAAYSKGEVVRIKPAS